MRKLVALFILATTPALAQAVTYWRVNIFVVLLLNSSNPTLVTFADSLIASDDAVACYEYNPDGPDFQVPDSMCTAPKPVLVAPSAPVSSAIRGAHGRP
jgi:hypothetical protein